VILGEHAVFSRLLGHLWKLPPRTNAVDRTLDLPVPVRDGEVLLADVYHPRGVVDAPTVLVRSPYGRRTVFGVMGGLLAERGYTAVVQSCRGTFGSGGNFTPFFQERNDGIDTVGWVEKQPWHRGKLGLYGPSYLGQVQWAIAAELGERIAAIAVVVSTSDFHAAIYDGGGFRLEDFFKWISMLARQEKSSAVLQALKEYVFGDPLRGHYARLPLRTLDEHAIGHKVEYWRTWLEHDDPSDPHWAPIQDMKTLERVRAPVTMVAGWSDVFIHYQLRDFRLLQKLGKTSRLTVGQWTHTDIRGSAAALRDALDWFGTHLKGRSHAPEAAGRVRLWVNGANEWRNHDAWPPAGTTPWQLSLGGDGRLLPGEVGAVNRSFTYDPSDPTPSLEGAKLTAKKGRGDMSLLAARHDVLAFDGPTLADPLELVGDLTITLTTSADSPHHDLFVCLCDVGPDGRSVNITDGYRRLPPGPAEATPRSTIIEAQPAAWRVPAGHRLRLLIAGGAFPRFARNLGLGAPLGDGHESRPVTITVHRGCLARSN
jgi:putative CocE/NonD family hydrolase